MKAIDSDYMAANAIKLHFKLNVTASSNSNKLHIQKWT